MLSRLLLPILVLCFAACGKSDPVVGFRVDENTVVGMEEKPTNETTDDSLVQPFTIADGLLTDPILQLPKKHSVQVVWYTSFRGKEHALVLGEEKRRLPVTSTQLSRMLEDADSEISDDVRKQLGQATKAGVRERAVFRHVATAEALKPGERLPYLVESVDDAGTRFRSDAFTLQPLPTSDQSVSLLLTSDQQNQPMSAANYQKVVETTGAIDAILFAGDFVDHPNRASEWFDRANPKRPAFYPVLQGRLDQLGATAFRGGALLQHAVLFGAVGNHDVSGRWRPEANDIKTMFNDPQPLWYAQLHHNNPVKVRDQSFESVTYEQMWDQPDPGPRGERYWASRYGETFIISLHVNRIWRLWGDNRKGKLCEAPESLANPDEWGFGDHVFDPFGPDSEQFQWLQNILLSPAFQQSKYKIVMAHQSMFGLGANALPALAAPQATFEIEGQEKPLQLTHPISKEDWENQVEPVLGSIKAITYHYPKEQDVWKQSIEPLLISAGVQLVLCGHSHLWNRTRVDKLIYLETSNVGNAFDARYDDPGEGKAYPKSKRPAGDPQNRLPLAPNQFNPMQQWEGYARPLPFVASNKITVFSLFHSEDGTVKSYAFDTTKPGSEVVLMDEFPLSANP